jgi:hypothetical protein
MKQLAALALLALAALAHAQTQYNGVPAATSYAVQVTWTVPAGQCATGDAVAPCGFNVYRSLHGANVFTLAGSTNPGTAPNATSYTDAGVSANTAYDYIVETVFSGANGSPSNLVTASVPPVPGTVVVTVTVAGQS